MIDKDTVYCDCCQTEILAKIQNGNIVIKARRHGTNHVAVIPIRDLLDKTSVRKYSEHK